MILPAFPAVAFPNSVTVRLCDDQGNREGGFNPVPGTGALLPASVQEHGAHWAGDRAASITEYQVYFGSDPSAGLSRTLRAGDQIEWSGLTLSILGPPLDRGGFGWLWRVRCEHVRT